MLTLDDESAKSEIGRPKTPPCAVFIIAGLAAAAGDQMRDAYPIGRAVNFNVCEDIDIMETRP